MPTITWLGVGVLAAAYITQRHRVAAALRRPRVYVQPIAGAQNDVTRWRHTGVQPIADFDGNKLPNFAAYSQLREIAAKLPI